MGAEASRVIPMAPGYKKQNHLQFLQVKYSADLVKLWVIIHVFETIGRNKLVFMSLLQVGLLICRILLQAAEIGFDLYSLPFKLI